MNSKRRVLLVQLPVPNNPSLNTPLAAGYLKAYAQQQGLLAYAEIELLPRHIADYAGDAAIVAEIIARQPDLLGVSLYTWNSERSLAIIRRVKAQLPQLRVVVGGPEVQKDNLWVLQHPAIDLAVIGEGEQTFCAILRHSIAATPDDRLYEISGLALRDHNGELRFTSDRVALNDLSSIPSPYVSGYLEVPADGMLMVEVSRWCPYSCSFCLYGRNMGSKLGNRYFGLERVLDEIRWGREHGIQRVHFVEANLNLVPLFWPLMHALAEINHNRSMTFYAELRGEYLTDEVVAALDRANVRYVEVGLQTANPTALKASLRRTNLQKWAAGTRRLYAHQIEVYLDVILGLPADDTAGIHTTLDFIQREQLGAYDVFTLQVLPGTAVRQQANQYGLCFQDRPPYYVLASDQLDYSALWSLRRELKQGANISPDAIEGMPEPRPYALQPRNPAPMGKLLYDQLWLLDSIPYANTATIPTQLAAHVDVVLQLADLSDNIALLTAAIEHNPSTIFDLYLVASDDILCIDVLRQWRAKLPFQPGYLDRVAVYQTPDPTRKYNRVSPRCFLLLPWTSTAAPSDVQDCAEIIWRFELAENDPLPCNAWYGAGGCGICVHFATDCSANYQAQARATAEEWAQEAGRRVWFTKAMQLAQSHVAGVHIR